jgi:XisI protein
MDHLNHYRQIIRKILKPYTEIIYANVDVRNRAAFDSENDQYLIISEGWDSQHHLHSVLIHIEIINAKVWVQYDGTEDGITSELLAAGISKEDIVLGFHEPEVRQYTGFAVA